MVIVGITNNKNAEDCLIKYIGSKAKIAYDILPIILKGMRQGDTFVDAFCGGCNLMDKVPAFFHRIANDKSRYLIAMWKQLLSSDIDFPFHISKELFAECRDCAYGRSDKYNDAFVGWVGFMGGGGMADSTMAAMQAMTTMVVTISQSR